MTINNIENYKKEKLTVNLVWANVFGVFLMIPTALIYCLPYYLIWGVNFKKMSFFYTRLKDTSPEWILLGLLIGIILHELIHGLFWGIYAQNGFKSIRFGVSWKFLAPYCHCKEPLMVKEYIVGSLMPSIILGLIPAIMAIVIGDIGLLLFGFFFTVAACGDFLVVNLLKKEKMDDFVLDHPSEAGCYIYRKE